ncbi:MAG: TIR domain-containing protein [Planctomycetota bacterium]
MKIFISWSGDRSRAVAEALRDWLPRVIQQVKPFVSSRDVDKGTLWPREISDNLQAASVGIICLTAENLAEPWLLFEAGALSRAIEKPVEEAARVCTFLHGLKPEDVPAPLGLFQATVAEEDDTLKMVRTINMACGGEALDEPRLADQFKLLWPTLDESLRAIPATGAPAPKRRTDEVLGEVLESVRGISRQLRRSGTSFWIPGPTHPEGARIQGAIRFAVERTRKLSQSPLSGLLGGGSKEIARSLASEIGVTEEVAAHMIAVRLAEEKQRLARSKSGDDDKQ